MIIVERRNDSVVIDTPAKVNLYLQVFRKRPDGYHDINSLFQTVSLFDTLRVSFSSSPGIDLTIKGAMPPLPTGDENLICKAFRLMAERFHLDYGISVSLTKRIPIAAGLGGGSSDAASTIMACNVLYGLGLTHRQMAELGLEIGSDLPFFFSTGQAIVTGRGEHVAPVELPVDYFLVLVTPTLRISTAEAYASVKSSLTNPKNQFRLGRCRTVADLVVNLDCCGNDFEVWCANQSADLALIRDWLLSSGAALARLSGSGPTMFGLYESDPLVEGLAIGNVNNWLVTVIQPIVMKRPDH